MHIFSRLHIPPRKIFPCLITRVCDANPLRLGSLIFSQSLGGIGKLVLKMKGLKATARENLMAKTGDVNKRTRTELDEATVDRAKEEGTLRHPSYQLQNLLFLGAAADYNRYIVFVHTPQSNWNESSKLSSSLSPNMESGIRNKSFSRSVPSRAFLA